MPLPRVSLLPHRRDWTELERDAVNLIEHAIAMRALDRPGDVIETAWTLSYVQKWLRRTMARRRGRDYARTVLATLVEELLRDTGEVLKPRKQPSRLRSSGGACSKSFRWSAPEIETIPGRARTRAPRTRLPGYRFSVSIPRPSRARKEAKEAPEGLGSVGICEQWASLTWLFLPLTS